MVPNNSNAIVSRRLIFHPLSVLLISLTGAFFYAVWARWRFSGDQLASQYFYVVPIVIPFVAFLLDRVKRVSETTYVGLAVNVLVVGTAMMRVFGDVPFVSGHALVLTYAVLGPGSNITRITAAVVWLEVVYLKFFVWHDLITPVTGIALGAVAALITRRYGIHAAVQPERLEQPSQ